MKTNKNMSEKSAEMLKEGYTEVAQGSGTWRDDFITDIRIPDMYSFYHPDGKVSTYEARQEKRLSMPVTGIQMKFHENEYTPKEFEEFIEKWDVTLGEKTNLEEFIASSIKQVA